MQRASGMIGSMNHDLRLSNDVPDRALGAAALSLVARGQHELANALSDCSLMLVSGEHDCYDAVILAPPEVLHVVDDESWEVSQDLTPALAGMEMPLGAIRVHTLPADADWRETVKKRAAVAGNDWGDEEPF